MQMVIFTKDSGFKIRLMEKDVMFILMVLDILEIGLMINNMD